MYKKLTKQISKFHISTQSLQENALFSGKIYTAGIGRDGRDKFQVCQLSQANLEPISIFPQKYFVLFCSCILFCFVSHANLEALIPSPSFQEQIFPQSWTILHQRDKS